MKKLQEQMLPMLIEHACQKKLDILLEQRVDLSTAIDTLLK